MSTKVLDPIPDYCVEELYIGSEETVSVLSEDGGNEEVILFESDDEEVTVGQPAPRGRADSGALLDMLAEVASQKLLFSPLKRDSRRSDGESRTAVRSNKQLIQLFSKTEFDEMRKWYTYICTFEENCGQKFVSFGNEERAKEKFKKHLFEHMENYTPPSPTSKKIVKRRISAGRRPRKVRQKSTEEVETSDETADANSVEEEDIKPTMEWTDNFILEETDNKVEVEIVGQEVETGNTSEISSAVVDLNGLIAGLSEKMGVSGEHSYSTGDETNDQSLLLYVVDGGTMVLKNAPAVSRQVDVNAEGEYSVIRSAELPVIANKRSKSPPGASALADPSAVWELSQGEYIERDEFHIQKKPKGKAKFIGQSRAEKEQAMEAIEAIRMKRSGAGMEDLTCVICTPPRTFTAPTTLISHYRSHAGIKPFECQVCESVFTRQHSLNYHMLIHQNQTRFTCQDCGRKFRHPSHFREHRRRHTGESPFECSDCLLRFKTRNTYKRHLRTRHGKVLTTSGGLIILSEDEFQMVRTAPRTQTPAAKKRKFVDTSASGGEIDAIDEDIQALHQLEIVNSNEGYEEYKNVEIDLNGEMTVDFLDEDGEGGAYEEIVKEAVRLEKAEAQQARQPPVTFKEEPPVEDTLVIETEDTLSGSGLYLATLEDGETVLVNTRGDDDDDDVTGGRVDLGLKLLEVGKVQRNVQEPTVIVIKNESFT